MLNFHSHLILHTQLLQAKLVKLLIFMLFDVSSMHAITATIFGVQIFSHGTKFKLSREFCRIVVSYFRIVVSYFHIVVSYFRIVEIKITPMHNAQALATHSFGLVTCEYGAMISLFDE